MADTQKSPPPTLPPPRTGPRVPAVPADRGWEVWAMPRAGAWEWLFLSWARTLSIKPRANVTVRQRLKKARRSSPRPGDESAKALGM